MTIPNNTITPRPFYRYIYTHAKDTFYDTQEESDNDTVDGAQEGSDDDLFYSAQEESDDDIFYEAQEELNNDNSEQDEPTQVINSKRKIKHDDNDGDDDGFTEVKTAKEPKFSHKQGSDIKPYTSGIDIVPVLPIIVPKRKVHLYAEKIRHYKRNLEDLGREASSSTSENKNIKTTALTSTIVNGDSTATVSTAAASASNIATSISNTAAPRSTSSADLVATINTITEQDQVKVAMMNTSNLLTENERNDPLQVAEHVSEIFSHLCESELATMADPLYVFSMQNGELTWEDRAAYIETMIIIQHQYGLLLETVYLAVNIFDRFLSLQKIEKREARPFCIVALFFAMKFEEKRPSTIEEVVLPSKYEFIEIANISKEEFVEKQINMFYTLQGRLCYANPFNFLDRLCIKQMDCTAGTLVVSTFLTYMTLLEPAFISVRPSKIAAAAVCFAKEMEESGWHSSLVEFSGYSLKDLQPVVNLMKHCLRKPWEYAAFFEVWDTKECLQTTQWVFDWIDRQPDEAAEATQPVSDISFE
jgi:hypothetical protein